MGNKSSHKHAVEKAISKPSMDCDGAFRIVFDHVYDKKFKVEDKNYATQLQLIQDMFPQIEEVVLPLFAYLAQCTTHSLQYMTYDNFMTNVLRFATAPDAEKPVMLEYYFDIFSQRQQSLNRDPALWISCYKASLMTAGLSDELPLASEESIFPSLLKSLFKDNQQVSRMDLVPWCAGNCRTLLMETDLQNYITQEMSDGRIKCSTKHPDFQVKVSARSNRDALAAKDYVITPALLWVIVMCVGTHDVFYPDHSSVSSTYRAIVHGGWVPLYSSKQHGLSVSRYKHYVFDYDGPTILVLSFNEKIFCLASDIAWNETSTQWRGKECVVFMLLDEWKVVSRDPNSVYFNLTERSAPRGIHVGKYGRGPLITINEDFSTVKYWEIEYKLDDMEVWGCGGQKILDAQQKQQRWEKEQAERQKDRKLKLEDWKDNPDRQLLQLGGVTTEHAQR